MGQQTSGLHDPGLTEHMTTTSAMEGQRPLNISMRGLADDILLDHILPLLDIRDILNLRRVSPPATRDVSSSTHSSLIVIHIPG